MKSITSSFVFALILFLIMTFTPQFLGSIGILLGGLGQIILLIILSLLLSIVYNLIFKGKLTDIFNALVAVYYVVFSIIKAVLMREIDGEGIVSTFADVLLISTGAALLIFISLSVVGKIFEKK